MHFTTSLLLLTSTLLGLITAQDTNRTFTLTAYNTTNPLILNQPVLIAPTSGLASVVIGITAPDKAPLTAYIYNRNIYRYCSTSPTGSCIGMLTKAYAGALTGWYFHFSDTDKPITLGPSPPLTGMFGVADDLEYPSPTTSWPHCKPKKPTRVKVLVQGADANGQGGSALWTACDFGEAGVGYEINSAPIPTFAHNGPRCAANSGIKFKVKYTAR